MKKVRVYFALGSLILGMTACGNNSSNQETDMSQGSQSGQTTQESGMSETQDVAMGENEGGLGAGEDAGESSENQQDMSGGWSEEMEGIKGVVVEALGDNYWPNAQLTPEMLEQIYGVTQDLYDDYLGEVPMISANVDTLLIIKAKNDKVEAVEKALNTYRDTLVQDTMQYPMNLGKIQASRIQTFGDYVCFVQLGADTMEASEDGNEAVIKQCQEQNELALEVIGHSIAKE